MKPVCVVCVVTLSFPTSHVCCQLWVMRFLRLSVIKPLITLAIYHKDARLHSLQDVSICLSQDATADAATGVEKEMSQSVILCMYLCAY